MKVVTLCIVTTALVLVAAGKQPPSETSYKILMLLPASSSSHKTVFMTLAEALADRGHKVSLIPQKGRLNKIVKFQCAPCQGDIS